MGKLHFRLSFIAEESLRYCCQILRMSSPPSAMSEILQLMEHELPEGRRHLQESHVNLEKVASYCEGNYMQAMDKRHALEETKSFTTQSLASVAYQINNLANNFLDLLNLQMNQLSNMESSINHLSQTVMIHKEKVARREIGVLTTNKTTSRPPGVKNPGIVFPDLPERPVKYVRKPIDYSVFDDIGHGVKVQQPSHPQRARRSSSTSSKSSVAPPGGQAPTTKPPTPPATSGIYSRTGGSTGGTLTRQTSSPYRAPVVSPPSVPSHYAPGAGYQAGTLQRQVSSGSSSSSSRGDMRPGYAPLGGMQPMQQQPPMGLVQPMPPTNSQSAASMMMPPPTPPPPPPMPAATAGVETNYGPGAMTEAFPPPPMPDASRGSELRIGDVSPPLPPPPDQGVSYEEQFTPPPPLHLPPGEAYGAPPGQQFRDRQSYNSHIPSMHEEAAEWVPKEYHEKVVAIYDYQKDKDDELSFNEGQVIYVIKKNDDGWWEGVLNGTTGLFPGNYVEPCI